MSSIRVRRLVHPALHPSRRPDKVPSVPIRPLVLFCALAGGDFLLLKALPAGTPEPVGMIAGLALPPLLIVCAWLFLLTGLRLLMGARSLAGYGGRARAMTARARAVGWRPRARLRAAPTQGPQGRPPNSDRPDAPTGSGKLAA
jgi:hypothetical protein